MLYLNNNQIGDQGAQYLGDALKTNQVSRQRKGTVAFILRLRFS